MRKQVGVMVADAGMDTEGPAAIDFGDGVMQKVVRVLYVCSAIGNVKGKRFTVLLRDKTELYVYRFGQKWYIDA